MSDVVVTVPKWFWEDWVAEGDAAGDEYSGLEWGFFLGGHPPRIDPGERVYVVCRDRLRGYSPLVRVQDLPVREPESSSGYALIRGGGAVAVTIDEPIPGFRGFRYRWWDVALERPFPDWRVA